MKTETLKIPKAFEKRMRAQADALLKQLDELDSARRHKENQKLVGRCFKYRNSYGNDRERWWLYARVTDAGKYWPTAFTFQKTSSGEYEVKTDHGFTSSYGYTPITDAEYNAAWGSFQKEIAAL